MNKFHRGTWVEVKLDALTHNYEQFKQLHKNHAIMAVIKANAYGHGDVEVAKCFTRQGATYLAVSSLDEALHLRSHEITTPLIILAPVKITDCEIAARNNITIVAYDEEWAKKLSKILLPQQLKIHIELETGMNRIGIRDLLTTMTHLKSNKNIDIEGIYTHIHSADTKKTSIDEQVEKFNQTIVKAGMNKFKYIHIANTATTLKCDLKYVNMQRVGLGLYGINPDEEYVKTPLKLKPAFSFHSELTQVSHIKKGESVSYGATYIAPKDTVVGTLSVGYADGWCRLNQGRNVKIKGQQCPIIGRICMDQLMIALPSDDFSIGEVVTLIDEEINAGVIAKEIGTIAYEVLTLISDRVPRVYVENKIVRHCYLGRNKIHI